MHTRLSASRAHWRSPRTRRRLKEAGAGKSLARIPMENLGYLFAAYAIIFAVILGYVIFIWRRQAALEAELRAIEARMKAVEKDGRASAADARAHS
jgi:CcmD family protein